MPGATMQVTTDHTFGRDRLYFGDTDVHLSPSWSPNGQELLILSNRGIPLGSGGVWRIPVAADVMNSGKAVLIHKEETLFRTRPQWSPDGKRFVYASHLGGQFVNLFVLPATGGEPYKLTFGEYDSFLPRWSPDGEWIAYVSNEQGLPQLKILKSWGGEARVVTHHAEEVEDAHGPARRADCRCRHRQGDRGARLPKGVGRQAVHAGRLVRAVRAPQSSPVPHARALHDRRAGGHRSPSRR